MTGAVNGPFFQAWRNRRLSGNLFKDLGDLGLDIDDVWPIIDREVGILMQQPRLRGRLSLMLRFAMLRGICLGIVYGRQERENNSDS